MYWTAILSLLAGEVNGLGTCEQRYLSIRIPLDQDSVLLYAFPAGWSLAESFGGSPACRNEILYRMS